MGDFMSETKNLKKQTATLFPIVGLGASAGGLEAFEKFFSNTPVDTGMAFLVVVHLDPAHESILPELLQRNTQMPVVAMIDGAVVEPNRVYVTPPNRDVVLDDGTLRLVEPLVSEGRRLPIDSFLCSLAAERGERAACVILSGSGSDGILGLKAIKENGGLALAQEPSSATFDSMPRSAIATGLVDYVVAPAELAETLVCFFAHAAQLTRAQETGSRLSTSDLEQILRLLNERTGRSFSAYKKNTLIRRVQRQMSLLGTDSVGDYVEHLRRRPEDVDRLFHELLIGVTSFFRDPEAFDVLRRDALPALLRSLGSEETLRVWVPGCSTGEEVYSLGMVLSECLATQARHVGFQIFGTDIDAHAIERAREGLYSLAIANDVSEERRQRFFEQKGELYRIRKDLRDCMVFAVQDILHDPPFTRIHLVCCRNLLIYIDSVAQKKLLTLFYYALKKDGLLFLGTSETIGGLGDLFTTVVAKWKIFRRRELPIPARPRVSFPISSSGPQRKAVHLAEDTTDGKQRSDLAQLVNAFLLAELTPTCILVDRRGRIYYIHGRSGKYLEPAVGKMSDNVLDMARHGLKLELATALRAVLANAGPVVRAGVHVKNNGSSQHVELTVRRLELTEGPDDLIAIILRDEAPPAKKSARGKRTSEREREQRITELEQELRRTRESHQAATEELETANEELKSINEELQSSNEELQSTNEELESAREEQQSLNEELVTVNAELRGRIGELSQTHDDLRNLLEATRIATLFLDPDLRIKRFTLATTRIVNLIPADVGRPLAHVVSNLEGESGLVEVARQVMESLESFEREVCTRDGIWYSLRAMPYRTTADVVDGVVMTFVDIDALRRSYLTGRSFNLGS